MIDIDEKAIIGAVVDKLCADGSHLVERVESETNKVIERQITKAMEGVGKALIANAAAVVMSNWQTQKIRRTNTWGDPCGEGITLPQWIEEHLTSKITDAYSSREFTKSVRDSIDSVVRTHAQKVIVEMDAQFKAAVSQAIVARLATVKVA